MLALSFSLVMAVPASANTDRLVTSQYTTIQAAINDASPGDTIIVADTYNSTLETFPITVDVANLTIQAATGTSPVIDGQGTMWVPAVHILPSVLNVTLEGFTIQNFKADASHDWAAVFVQGDGATIQDNTVLNITTADHPNPFGIGIDVAANNVDVIGNRVYDVDSIGIRIVKATYQPGTETTGVLVENNEVYQTGNTGVVFAGRVVNSTIRGNHLYDSGDLGTPYNLLICWGLDMTLPPSGITIEGNNIHGGYGNVVLAGAENITISGNTITGAVEIPSFAKGKNIYILDNYLPFGVLNYLSTNIEITSNDILDADGYGVRIKYTGAVPADGVLMASTTTINFNNISGNSEYGVENTIATDVDATNNWWGAADGPSLSPGSGDRVSGNVDYDPWLVVELAECESECICGCGCCSDTPTGGDVTIDAEEGGYHTITTAKYTGNPGGTPTFEATGNYYDVCLDNDTGVNSLTIEFCPADEDTVIYYWDETSSSWEPCSAQYYLDACIVVTITSSTFPSLSDLTGTPFGSGTPYPTAPAPAPAPRGGPVGGEVYPVNKANVLAPWLSLALVILIGGSILVVRRRTSR